ncbi:hypothetical protein D9619_001850 [Psilocybe cf. subviscida]|uniref:Endonuclease/exonuclease/phosphatase domain-containing protein n=1 Tax=Psilocybe cf. subviscida TaxID=2480587 RepID=A0A8H5F259_9AGAR|nr:hypothetical protein D9619_001850 [Psilocybe cf. subviscida]
MTYEFRLWYFAGAKNKTAIKVLNKMQRQPALWMTGAFCTSPGGGIKALAGLMPLHMTLAKLSSGSVTRVVSLSDTHPDVLSVLLSAAGTVSGGVYVEAGIVRPNWACLLSWAGVDHLATARKCVFFQNRFDRKWITARYAQEPPWRLIRSAPSAVSVEGEEVVGAPNHPSWLAMVRPPDPDMNPCVMAYVSTWLSTWRPSMCRDIIDHRDVLVLSLFAEGHTFNFMNVYSDNKFTAIRLLAARADTLPQFHYMGGDFNCHSSAWDPVPCPANVAASHWLLEAAATIGLELGTVSNPGPTHIPRDASKHPSVIDMVFLPVALSASVSTERVIQNMLDLDHIPLLTHVPVLPAVRTALRRCLPSDPEKVQAFLDNLVAKLRLIVPDNVAETPDDVEAAASAVASTFSEAWLAHSRDSNVTRRSNPWWNEACATALQQHCASRDPAD